MTPAQERALWDFVRALADERTNPHIMDGSSAWKGAEARRAQMLATIYTSALSVLAEEAPPATYSREHFGPLIGNALRLYREESEKDRAAMLSTYGEIQTLGRENDILRGKVEKALARLGRHVSAIGDIPGCVCHVCSAHRILKGEAEGTEATK